MERIDCAVIGAGVIGLAVARAMARAGREVAVLEAEGAIGTGISSRNSEVIHSGLYYPQRSLKAELCVKGRRALYAYCEANHIPHRRCGKLIVATDEDQLEKLAQIKKQASMNGVDDLLWLEGARAMAIEPDLRCVAALLSPGTGIVDTHALMLSLQGDAERAGAVFAFQSSLEGGEVAKDGIRLFVHGAKDDVWVANQVINCAGLNASHVAASLRGLDQRFVPQTFYAKGNYFSYTGSTRFTHLIYPIPGKAGLGVHLTLDLAGRPRFGPDVEWISDIDYRVSAARVDAFYEAVRKYWPGLPEGSLTVDYSGIRPKLSGPNGEAQDFRIDDVSVHGVPGLVNLFGIESPGLTSVLAVAEYISQKLRS